jgi:hypothetical protein
VVWYVVKENAARLGISKLALVIFDGHALVFAIARAVN